jgi:hypothetical protein
MNWVSSFGGTLFGPKNSKNSGRVVGNVLHISMFNLFGIHVLGYLMALEFDCCYTKVCLSCSNGHVEDSQRMWKCLVVKSFKCILVFWQV